MTKRIFSLAILLGALFFLSACRDKTKFKIEFESNGGTPLESITYDASGSVSIPKNPTKEGYVFSGWFLDNETFLKPFSESLLLIEPLKDNLKIYAKWTVKSYKVNYVDHDDKVLKTEDIDFSSALNEVTAPSNPSRVGYTFKSWDNVLQATMPAENITIKAIYTINQYTISFEENGGVVVNDLTQDYGTVVLAPAISKEGHTFVGWFTDEDLTTAYTFTTMPASNETVYAKWTVNSYKVNYVDHDDKVLKTEDIDFSSALNEVTAPSNPSRVGYTFKSWDNVLQATMPAENITIKAIYTINQYTISFEENDGVVVNDLTQDYGTTVTAPETTREGYTLVGWFTDAELTVSYTFTTMAASNIILYAKWSINSYTLSYKDYDGTVLKTEEIEYGTDLSTYTAPSNPERRGYTFSGWNNALPATMPAETITMQGTYTINQYTISIEENGAEEVANITQDYDSSVTAPELTREGYTIGGWFSDVEMIIPYIFDTMPEEDITVYAKWLLTTYTINYNLDGGINGSNPDSYTIETNTITLEDPRKEEHTFTGWYDNDEFIGDFITLIELGSTGNTTLYAQFIPYQVIEHDDYIAIIGGQTDLMAIPTSILGKPVTQIYLAWNDEFGGQNPVYIPETISYIYYVFGQYASSSEWIVDEQNQYYASVDGVLYTKDLSVLLSYPKHKTDATFELPQEVREISWGAFYRNEHLKSVILNEGLEIIGPFAFMWSDLITIHIPSTVLEINSKAFYGRLVSWYGYENLNYLKSVTFAPNSQLRVIGSEVFRDNQIKNLVLPDTVEYIGDQAFGMYEGEITLPSNLQEFYLSAFFSISNTTLVIPASVTDLVRPGNQYHYSPNTVNFDVDINNANYASVDGVIYNKEITEIIAVPRGKIQIVLPSTVTHLNEYYVHFWPYMSIYLEVIEKPSSFSDTWFDQAVIYLSNEWSYADDMPVPN